MKQTAPVGDPVRCTLNFQSITELRTSWTRVADGRVFVPWPEELEAGRLVMLRLAVEGQGSLQVTGTVLGPDFDESGNVGVTVALAQESRAALQAAVAPAPEESGNAVFGTTRLQAAAAQLRAPATAPGTDEPAGQFLEPGTLLEDRFEIEAHIATGGMGEVYRAVHVHLKRPVALKLLKRVFLADQEMWARFRREAELVSQLESPHIVRVFDFGQTASGEAFLAMEYVDGVRLDTLLENGPLEPARAVGLLSQIFTGLEEAHAAGIIHRDLKPPNIMVGRKRDGSEVAKILDFGIARLADKATGKDSKLTQVGMVVGTPAYLAPEQALAGQLDERTDVYAMGCVAFELLCGRPPFVGESLQQVVAMQLTAQPPDPAQLRPELARFGGLRAAILKALSKEKERRFANVREFRVAMEAGLTPRAATAVPAPAPSEWGAPPPAAAPPPPEWGADPGPAAPPPPEWGAAPAAVAPPRAPPRAATPVALPAADADDFFTGSGLRARPTRAGTTGSHAALKLSRLQRQLKVLQADAPPELLQALDTAHGALEERALKVALARVEVMGPQPGTPLHRQAVVRLLEATRTWKGAVDGVDEDGLVLLFADDVPAAALARATRALLQAREELAEDVARGPAGAAASYRAAVVHGAVETSATQPVEGDLLRRAQVLAARFPAGTLAVERAAAAEVADVVELKALATPDAVELGGRRAHLKRVEPPLVGRDAVLASLDKRVASAMGGVVAPVVVRGPRGSGRTVVAEELATRARQKGMVVGQARAAQALRDVAFGAVTELICHVLGVAPQGRAADLPAALLGLKLPAPALEAVRVVTGLSQLPQAFTAGQAVHALRMVLKAGAAERPQLLLFDGLEAMDETSLECFRELVLHPAARELTVGFSTEELARERLEGVSTLDFAPLSVADQARLAGALVDGTPARELLDALAARGGSSPGRLSEWLLYLDDAALLRERAGAVHGPSEWPELEGDALAQARWDVLPLEARRLLEAAVVVGDGFEGSALQLAWPRATQAAFQRAALSRWMRHLGQRRWTLAGPRVRDVVAGHPSSERALMHLRVAAPLLEAARAHPERAETQRLAAHFAAAQDGARAAPLWKHGAESALARRALRDALTCLRGWSDALGMVPGAPPTLTQGRVEGLARAVGLALSLQEATLARTLVDEALALAQGAQVQSAELALSLARVHRSEARRARAAEALAQAEALARGGPLLALVEAERGEAREQEGDLVNAMLAFEKALVLAPPATELARWHGEVDLVARLEARLGSIALSRKDFAGARKLNESSLSRWRAANWPYAESRVLANLGTASAMAKDMKSAPAFYGAAAAAAMRCGDLLFQARMLVQQARALKLGGELASAKLVATEARKLCLVLAWDEGRGQAEALLA